MRLPLSTRWELARTPPSLARSPAELPDALDWLPASVPGTAAAALRQAGSGNTELDREDIWYRAPIQLKGPHRLYFAGLATLAEVWVDGEKRLESGNMFRPTSLDADLRGGRIHIRFRSLLKALEGKRGRPRWRPRMATPPGLRAARTTLLGHMPGWCPSVQAVGPWRPITALPLDGVPRVESATLATVLRPDGDGELKARVRLTTPAPVTIRIGDHQQAIAADGAATIMLPQPALWWPHTHGAPHLHAVELTLDGATMPLGAVGFRRIAVDRGADGKGFGLRVYDVPVFCRGANWITADLTSLPCDPAAFAPWLAAARDAGMNMLRVPGVAVYEADAFYEECDRLGLLVWQDGMFANFDYPADDPAFRAEVEAEIDAFLRRTSARACLAVFCGGSEIAQQAAMLGAPAADYANALFDQVIPDLIQRIRPELIYTPHSPHGGALPFQSDSGIAHYYGVGAYQRPLEDARRAGVRFASECLAFANVPEENSIARHLRVWRTHDPRWKEGVPRDAGASWDFEDVRDYYLALLYGENPARLRYEDPARYLDLSRAVVAEVIEAAFAEWRRPNSVCQGALVWTFQDLRPGAGWGVMDHAGQPKSAWYALRRACRPVQLAITDEGLNGLALHLLNDTPAALDVELRLTCLADGRIPVAGGQTQLSLPPHAGRTLGSAVLLESFFDITYAYRFGPPAHDVAVATLTDQRAGRTLAEAFHFPRGHALPRQEIGLQTELQRDEAGWLLRLQCQRFAQSVHWRDPVFRGLDNWFHMAPGRDYSVRLMSSDTDARPEGEVLALNALSAARYGGA